jgi:hypothetical protein
MTTGPPGVGTGECTTGYHIGCWYCGMCPFTIGRAIGTDDMLVGYIMGDPIAGGAGYAG